MHLLAFNGTTGSNISALSVTTELHKTFQWLRAELLIMLIIEKKHAPDELNNYHSSHFKGPCKNPDSRERGEREILKDREMYQIKFL